MAADAATHPSPTFLLTQSMASGDDAAFTQFHASYAGRLLRYSMVLMRGDEHAAADVAQDALVRVARHIRCFSDEGALWSWLTVLARSAAADHGRKTGRYFRFLKFFSQAAPVPEPTVDDQLEAALDTALEKLSPADAALLRAKHHEGIPQRELALQHGISEEAMESRLRRARAELRRLAFEQLHQSQL
jgi:RNA polymerase sigma-70 factor, ECF subfamily